MLDKRILLIILGGLVTGLAGMLLMEAEYVRWIAIVFPLAAVLLFSRFAAGPLDEKTGAWFGLVAAVPLTIQFFLAAPEMVDNMRYASDLAQKDPAAYLEWRLKSIPPSDQYQAKEEGSAIIYDLTTLRSDTDAKKKEEISARIREAGKQAERDTPLTVALGMFCPLLAFALLGMAGGWAARKLDLKPKPKPKA